LDMQTINFREFMDGSWKVKPKKSKNMVVYSAVLLSDVTLKSLLTFSPEMKLAYAFVGIAGGIPIILGLGERWLVMNGRETESKFLSTLGGFIMPVLFFGSLIWLFTWQPLFFG
jgi:hypothetical protein